MVVWLYLGAFTFLFAITILYAIFIGLSKKWPKTKAKIIHSELVEYKDGGEASKKVLYKPTVVYEYVVESKNYSSKTISSGFPAYKNKDIALEILSQYTLANSVTVYYHPVFHWVSFLRPGFEKSTIYIITFCAFLTGLPLISVIGSRITGHSGWLLDPIFWVIDKIV